MQGYKHAESITNGIGRVGGWHEQLKGISVWGLLLIMDHICRAHN